MFQEIFSQCQDGPPSGFSPYGWILAVLWQQTSAQAPSHNSSFFFFFFFFDFGQSWFSSQSKLSINLANPSSWLWTQPVDGNYLLYGSSMVHLMATSWLLLAGCWILQCYQKFDLPLRHNDCAATRPFANNQSFYTLHTASNAHFPQFFGIKTI